ncbi:hypothetical protein O3P69_002304 [Scylla paramamosain]|uniref:Uncharacterized protein n=1 Tax=Scylla paramamosain TaxID=85552 RepID=A0AAW0V8I6_SCYPA
MSKLMAKPIALCWIRAQSRRTITAPHRALRVPADLGPSRRLQLTKSSVFVTCKNHYVLGIWGLRSHRTTPLIIQPSPKVGQINKKSEEVTHCVIISSSLYRKEMFLWNHREKTNTRVACVSSPSTQNISIGTNLYKTGQIVFHL